jgi:Lrp/AsnC family transcriptional regulator, leucine-responsive regulatory protein
VDETSVNELDSLDRIDRQLLAELQRDGRVSIAELARRVHLSPTPCLERVKRLERNGIIRDYVARLDAGRVGFPVLTFVEVAIDRTTPESFERFGRLMQDLDEVVECHMIAGQFDYLLKVRTASTNAFRRFLGEKLTAVPGIQHTHTYFALEETKAGGQVPIKPGRREVVSRRQRRNAR